jgi:type I restriction enzyme M protein
MNHSPTGQETIERALQRACELLRDAADPVVQRNHVLAMFFFKAVTGIWQDQVAACTAQYAEHPELVAELLANERFVVPPQADFAALLGQRNEPGNGARIDAALLALMKANDRKLRGIFHDISFHSARLCSESQRNDMLASLLEHFARPDLDLRPSRAAPEFIARAFGSLFDQVAAESARKGVEFHTAAELSILMAALTAPEPGEVVCDPVCGSASTLIHCARYVRERGGERGGHALCGQEVLGDTTALARMNLYLHGEDNHRIEWGDVIANPRLVAGDGSLMRFDVGVAHPPFAVEKWRHEVAPGDTYGRFRHGVPPRTKGDYGFIQHMIASMKPERGRFAIVVPHGVLFRGVAESVIRKNLVRENLLDTVVGLPEKLFAGASISCALLVFKSRKQDDNILFIDARHGYLEGKNQNILRAQDIERICAAYRDRQPRAHYACLATPAQIAANDFNLNISRYVDTAGERENIDLQQLREQRKELQLALSALELEMEQTLNAFDHE